MKKKESYFNDKIDWTDIWSKQYPVLSKYREQIDVIKYHKEIKILLDSLKKDYNLSGLEAMLVLKDILYHEWKETK